jgi:ribosome-associated protein
MSQPRILPASLFGNELEFSTSRSSGPGGQNVNKVNSKVTLQFHIGNSQVLSPEEKELLSKKLASQLTKEGYLILSSQDSRSQIQNREAVMAKFEKLLASALKKQKTRKATKPSKGSVKERINKKKQHAEKKKWRQKPI